MYKRVILKLSGEALSGETSQAFDNITINNIVKQVKELMEKGVQVSIVVGGGNFWRGRDGNSKMDRCKSDQIGMMATIMNAVYLSDTFSQYGIKASVMTPFIVGSITEEFSKEKALEYLEKGKVLIFACGIGHPFFSTDTITALRASELSVDAILFAKSIDGVYDKDPAIHNDAKKFEIIACKDVVEKNLKVIDIAAANLCYEQKIPIIIFGLLEKDSIKKACAGEKIGTVVTV
ncbi:MAG: UMP kinase [Eubacteriales bacterium]|nr:UMP kinase [Eubacteriales bacterium]